MIILILLLCIPLATFCTVSTPHYPFRSQSVNLAREDAGWSMYIDQYCGNCLYGAWSITPEYTHTYGDADITRAIFGNMFDRTDTTNIRVSGSTVSGRRSNDWLADYFGLPRDFVSMLSFNPSISNIVIDADVYWGLHNAWPGLYFRMHIPFVHTRWHFGFEECVIEQGTLGYPEGYVGPTAVDTQALLHNMHEYMMGVIPNFGSSITIHPLCASKFPLKTKSKNGISDIQLTLGINPVLDCDYHFGFGLTGSIPTGTRINARTIFEPIIGNGHHGELGALINGHAILWRSLDENMYLNVRLDARATYLFGTKQERSFDIKGSNNSRYMLAERLTTNVHNLFANPFSGDVNGSKIPAGQFANELTPLANLTTRSVEVKIPAQVDAVIMFTFKYCDFTFDLGYEYWSLSCEDIAEACMRYDPLHDQAWALKGDAMVYGFLEGPVGSLPANTPIPLSATETLDATINSGTNGTVPSLNPNIDNPQFARASADNVGINANINSDTTSHEQTHTSFQPAILVDAHEPGLITVDSLNIKGAATQSSSNKAFFHIHYEFPTCIYSMQPYIGIGGEIEIGSNSDPDRPLCAAVNFSGGCATACEDCKNVTPSQWGIWIKGGCRF